MKERWKRWREMLPKSGKNQWVFFLAGGILLLLVAFPDQEENAVTEADAVQTEGEDYTDAARILEEKLEKVLSDAAGVGKVKVILTLKSDGKKIVEKDTSRSESVAEESEAEKSSTSREESVDEGTIYEKDSSGRETPYVTENLYPEVSGVLVAAEGGDDPVVVAEITEAVQALFGTPAHKIKVMKMN